MLTNTYRWNEVPKNEYMEQFRIRQNELKINYINALKDFNRVEIDPALERIVLDSKAELLKFEGTIPGSNGEKATVDHDPTNRDHQAL